MAQAQPTHMTNNTHTWGEVQLHRVAWDSYNRNPIGVTQETSNDKLTIQNLVCQLQAKGE